MILLTNDRQTFSSALEPLHFTPLPLGSITPGGWLRRQLQAQADGLTGHLDEFWPSVAQSRWIGGEAEGWERGPYWLDGLIPLAFLLGDDRLKAKAQFWIDYILDHQHADGWLGAKDDAHVGLGQSRLDPWPQFVLFKAMRQWHEVTGDARIVPAMHRAMQRIHALLKEEPLQSWARMRWMELVLSVHWVHEQTGDPDLLALATLAHEQGFDWRNHFTDFPATERTTREQLKDGKHALNLHGVNNAMGLKEGVVWGRQSGDADEQDWIFHALDVLDRFHGQITGMFSADEHFAGLNPSQGTELCTIVELMYTLEVAFAATGDPRLADRLERVAYNALPGGITPDMRAHVYHQQINQVLCDVSRRDWVSSGLDANIYGLEPNFGCCTANLHQGWPKLASHAWMKADDGLVALAYCPVTVRTTSADGTPVEVQVETEYPFRDTIALRVTTDAPTNFALHLRIPAWAEGATLTVGNETRQGAPGEYLVIRQTWSGTTQLTLTLPMKTHIEPRLTGAVSVTRGPLVYALQIAERQEKVKEVDGWADYAYHPESPWNYALAARGPEDFTVREAPLGSLPFDPVQIPVMLETRARRLARWGMKDNSADAPPSRITVEDVGEPETVTFVPFGFARLRVAELPHLPV